MKVLNKLSYEIIGCAYAVYNELGPGLLESTYELCLGFELQSRNIQFRKQVPLPVEYQGNYLEGGYRIDLMVEDKIIIEIKSVEIILPVHKAQLITYLKLSGKNLGLLINFNVKNLQKGITRIIN